jgi:hypothetical protein
MISMKTGTVIFLEILYDADCLEVAGYCTNGDPTGFGPLAKLRLKNKCFRDSSFCKICYETN